MFVHTQKGIEVINSARQGSVTGTLVGSTGSGASGFGIVAFPAGGSGPTCASKLNVGLSFLAGLYLAGVKGAFGPYWVVAAGELSGERCLVNLGAGSGGV